MKPCMIHPRHEDSSIELTEVRTVLMRAYSALDRVDSSISKRGTRQYEYEIGDYRQYEPDPDAMAMRQSLARSIELLDRWQKCPTKCEGRK